MNTRGYMSISTSTLHGLRVAHITQKAYHFLFLLQAGPLFDVVALSRLKQTNMLTKLS